MCGGSELMQKLEGLEKSGQTKSLKTETGGDMVDMMRLCFESGKKNMNFVYEGFYTFRQCYNLR